MTAAPRAARSLEEALGLALEDLEAGLAPFQILSRYPQYEAELGPLLETAFRLHTTRWPVLSMAARVSGRERMHAALVQQRGRRRFIVAPVWRQLGAALALVLLAGTTYIASPISPLRSMNRPRLTGTVPVTATATWTAAPTATTKPPATVAALVPRGPTATIKVVEVAEPAETADPETDLKHSTPSKLPTLLSDETPTRPASTRAPSVTATATVTSTATITPMPSATITEPPASSEPATRVPAPPSPTATDVFASPTPTATPTQVSTPAKPTPTTVIQPTNGPDPTQTATARPRLTPLPTSTHWAPTLPPIPTDQPTPTGESQTSTPQPTARRHSTSTPEPAQMPEGVRISSKLLEPVRDQPKPLGQVIREAIKELQRLVPAWERSSQP